MAKIAETIKEFLERVSQKIVQDQNAKNITASGLSAQSLRTEVDTDGGKLFGIDYFKYQVRGRAPGGMPPVKSIEDWIVSKGIHPEGGGTIEGMAWAIAKKIEKNGTEIFRGSRPGLDIPGDIDRELNNFRKKLLKGTKEEIFSSI